MSVKLKDMFKQGRVLKLDNPKEHPKIILCIEDPYLKVATGDNKAFLDFEESQQFWRFEDFTNLEVVNVWENLADYYKGEDEEE